LQEDTSKDLLPSEAVDTTNSDVALDSKDRHEDVENSLPAQDPTLALHEKLSIENSSGRLLSTKEVSVASLEGSQVLSNMGDQDERVGNGEVNPRESRRRIDKEREGHGGSSVSDRNLSGIKPPTHEASPQK
ncbi:hypothetical protein MKX01_010390, partial [Papaver californicum]